MSETTDRPDMATVLRELQPYLTEIFREDAARTEQSRHFAVWTTARGLVFRSTHRDLIDAILLAHRETMKEVRR